MRKLLASLAALALWLAPIAALALPPSVSAPPYNAVNSTPYTSNLDPALTPHYRAAIAKVRAAVAAGTGGVYAKILCVCDSLGGGFTSSASVTGFRSQSWLSYLQALGVAGLPTQSDSFFADASTAAHTYTWSTWDPRIVVGSGWSTSGGTFTVGGQYAQNTTTTNSIDFTPAGPVDTCTLIFLETSSSGNFKWSVDGGSLSASIPTSNATSRVWTQSVSAGTPGIHKISFFRDTGSVFYSAAECYNSTTSAVQLWQAPILASRLYAPGTNSWSDTTYAWSGGNAVGTTPFAPDLCIIALGVNDYANGVAVANSQTGLQTLVTACQKSGDVVFLLEYPSNPATYSQASQSAMLNMEIAFAAANNIPVINWPARIVSWQNGVNLGLGLSTDPIHPSASAYADVAYQVAQALTQLAGGPGSPALPPLTGTTGSIGGSALTVGTCTSGTATVNGVATNMTATAQPVTYPGDGIWWSAYVLAANTVTVKVCASASITPTATTYNVRVAP